MPLYRYTRYPRNNNYRTSSNRFRGSYNRPYPRSYNSSRYNNNLVALPIYRRRRYTGLPRTVSTVRPRPEQKFFDTGSTAVSIPNSGALSAIFIPNRGPGPSDVLGNTCNLKSVYARYTITVGAGGVPAAWRVIIGYDRQSNANLAGIGDVLTAADVSSFMNLNNRDRFVIFSNEYGTVNPAGQAEVYNEVYPKINMQCTINGTNGAIPTTGSIFLLVISDQATAANQPVINGTYRVKFVDC